MTFSLISELPDKKMYKVEDNDILIAKKVEADASFQETVDGASYSLEGDMDDPKVMWLTVSL